MTTIRFSICKSVKTPAQMQPCTPELLNAAFDNQLVSNTCREIAMNLQKVKEGTLTRDAFETLKGELKAQNLPVVCFHANFTHAPIIIIRWLVVRQNCKSLWRIFHQVTRVFAWCL